MKDIDFANLFESMKKNDISEVVIKEGSKEYEFRRGGFKNTGSAVQTQIASAPVAMPAVNTPAATVAPPVSSTTSNQEQAAPVKSEPSAKKSNYHEIKAPLVGTFYVSPNPDAAAFVEVGDKVTKGQTICIVEAMKNFNEIESDVNGTVKEICVSNSDLVEYGQVLFRIEA